jgi:chorismate-pyruvate lyase
MIVADRLAELHFTALSEASAHLEGVQVSHLDPFLRGLLFTDGTVSRTLEAQMLAPVTVETVAQEPASPPAQVARHLDVDQTDACIRRRIVMTSAGTRLSVWAESYVVPSRLPAGFVGSLGESPRGIGGTLRRLRMEDWRELLWFGLAAPPPWSGASPDTRTLMRFYRIITQGRPALLISEAFAVEARLGVYRLLDSDAPAPNGASTPARPGLGRRIITGDQAPSGDGETSASG